MPKIMIREKKTKVRIIDIARMAGVSAGTVDRVIHNRGKVSEDNLIKVRRVLDHVDYQPNMMARSLASGREYVIYVVIPAFREGEYWADVNEGCARAAGEVAAFNVSVRLLFFDQYDEQSFDRIVETLRRKNFDGVLVATLFAERVAAWSVELDCRGIPYVFIDAAIEGCNNLAYFGISSFDAGMVGARMLLARFDTRSDIVVGQMAYRGTNGSNQWRLREEGFHHYLRQRGFTGRIHHALLDIHTPERNFEVLDRLFEEYPAIEGAITFNSTCYILGNYLRARVRERVRLVGYDLIPRNEQMLREGVIDVLVAQRPESQGYHGVMALEEYLIGGRKINKVNNMPIDILMKENIQYYKNNNI